MGFFGRLFGAEAPLPERTAQRPRRATPGTATGGSLSDAQALERYRYMLRTAPPETIEQAHAEAFAKLTAEQRQQVLAGLAESAPAAESAAILATPLNDTQALARTATRAEIRQPGVMERTMASPGLGFGASLLSSFAMGFVGSMVANAFFSAIGGFGEDPGAQAEEGGTEESAQADDTQLANHESEEAGYGDAGFDDGGGGFDDYEV
jgi:hypothetical protein